MEPHRLLKVPVSRGGHECESVCFTPARLQRPFSTQKQHCPRVLEAGEALSSRHLVSLLQMLIHTLMFYSLLKKYVHLFLKPCP